MKVRISILLLNTVSNSNHEIIVAIMRGSETRNLIHGRVFVEGSVVLVNSVRIMHFEMINGLTLEYLLYN